MGRKTKNIHATELYFNKVEINKLLNVDTEREDYPQDKNLYMDKEEVGKLKGLLKGSKYNKERDCFEKKIIFKKKKYGDIEYGRLYAEKDSPGSSLQNAWKPVREFMFDGKVIGFDMVNSQPNILYQLCQKFAPNETFPFLSRYVKSRDEVRRELFDYYKVPMKTIKTIIISLCFGANIEGLYKKHQLLPNDFLNGFYQETTKIKQETCHLFPDFQKAIKVYNYRKERGDFKDKKNNCEENSAIAMYLQNIEGEIMLTIYDVIKSDEEIIVACVIHDEICFENNDYVANNKQAIMCKMEEAVFEKLEFSIKLHDEPYIKNNDFVKRHEEFDKTEKLDLTSDDERNGRALFEALKDKVNKSKLQGRFMYDDEQGLWVYTQDEIRAIVYRHSSLFISTKMDKDGVVYRIKRDLYSMYEGIMKWFWGLVPYTDELEPDNSRGYLLFKNGVLDCYNFEMLPFDPKYNFTRCINRNFDANKDYTENMKLIREKIFETAYTDGNGDTEKMDYFMEVLSVALMEGGVDKRYLTMLGETNSGKGVLTALLRKSFDEFISTFNTSVLLQGSNADLEDASKWRFLTKCYDTRMMIGNEIAIQSQDTTNAFGHKKRTEKGLNVEMLKMLVSGGDSIEARRLRENEITIVNRSFVLMLANDMPMTKADEALANRTLILEACRSSTLKETFDDKEFFKADTEIKDWISKVQIRDAFVALMCQVYKKKKHNRSNVPKWITEKVEVFVEVNSSFQWVNDNYDVYKGDIIKDFQAVKGKQYYTVNWNEVGDYCVRADMMYNLYKDGGGMDSVAKFGTMLTNKGIILVRKKIKGCQVSYRVGISMLKDDINDKLNFRSDDEDDDSDCDNDFPDPKKPHNYPPSKPYTPPEPKQKTIFEMAFSK